jgi:hypothetical protein
MNRLRLYLTWLNVTLLILICAVPLFAAVTLVQSTNRSVASAGTSEAITFTAAVANDLLFTGMFSTEPIDSGDIAGPGGWTQVDSANAGAGVNGQTDGYYLVASGGETSATWSNIQATRNVELTLMEFSGLISTTPLDQHTHNQGSSVSSLASGTTSTLGQTVELCIASFGLYISDGSKRTGTSFSASYTKQIDAAGGGGMQTQIVEGYLVTAATTGQTTTLSWTGAADQVNAIIGCFKASVAVSLSRQSLLGFGH